MAESIDKFRKAQASNAAARVGLRLDQPKETVGDMSLLGNGSQSDIFALPVDTTEWAALQDLDPDSPTFTMPFFLVDVDIPGAPNRPIPSNLI